MDCVFASGYCLCMSIIEHGQISRSVFHDNWLLGGQCGVTLYYVSKRSITVEKAMITGVHISTIVLKCYLVFSMDSTVALE